LGQLRVKRLGGGVEPEYVPDYEAFKWTPEDELQWQEEKSFDLKTGDGKRLQVCRIKHKKTGKVCISFTKYGKQRRTLSFDYEMKKAIIEVLKEL
jgi:hypothetical protein